MIVKPDAEQITGLQTETAGSFVAGVERAAARNSAGVVITGSFRMVAEAIKAYKLE